MALTGIYFNNFKGFKEDTTIDLHPLNIHMGHNSGGKSSATQALRLMMQSFQDFSTIGDLSSREPRLTFRHPDNDLGGFRTVATGHNRERSIGLGLSIDSRPPMSADPLKLSTVFSYDEDHGSKLDSLIVEIKDRSIKFARRKNGDLKCTQPSARVILDWWQEEISRIPHNRSSKQEEISPNADDLRSLEAWLSRNKIDFTYGWIPSWPLQFGTEKRGRPFISRERTPALLDNLRGFWDFQSYLMNRSLAWSLGAIEYVGPLRQFPARITTEASESRGIGPRGERLAIYLSRHPDVTEDINRALSIMEMPYRINIRDLHEDSLVGTVGDVVFLTLTDVNSGLVATPADVGFGVSQVLPVIMRLMSERSSTVIIEQPELHLHPRLQARLGDVVVKSVSEYRNQVILETHSEHLLRRIQRRIREGQISPSSLAVRYFDSAQGFSTMTSMLIDKNGDLLNSWPGGFFDESYEDLFAGRSAGLGD